MGDGINLAPFEIQTKRTLRNFMALYFGAIKRSMALTIRNHLIQPYKGTRLIALQTIRLRREVSIYKLKFAQV